MRIITAKQLKQNTGEVIKLVRAGESLTLTYRGKPIAIIRPAEDSARESVATRFDEAWKDIEMTLAESEPRFSDWREATRWIRGRS
ncbi:MAG: type II toxin-antitoxin system prevent-host-death family antitoxin [Spirochaetaceae bacterium]|nr:MAG: type II toxin-antitoxin system prevent-host-death family antitoxin [Spirochaetaceae bacterium]